MARRKGGGDSGGGGSEWLNTYADMVTLLLTFFILLFSMSSLDAAKFNMLVRAFASDTDSSERIVINNAGDGQYQSTTNQGPETSPSEIEDLQDLGDIYEYLKQYIESNNLENKVAVSQGEGYVFIRFMDDMLFEPNSARLKTTDLEILNFVGYGIKSVQNKAKIIRIDGHTAAIPENPNYQVSDRVLSSDRANTVLMYFEDVIGINSEKMLALAFGKNYPIASNDREETRAQNRRVEILISGENVIGDELTNIYANIYEKLME